MKLAGFIAEFAQGDKDFGKNKIVPNVFDSGLYEYLEEKFKIFFDSLQRFYRVLDLNKFYYI